MGGNSSKQPQYWEKDQEHPQCQLCDTKFSVIRRRHHCRNCGGVFCAACTQRTATVPLRGFQDPVRVCDRCKLREGGLPSLGGTTGGASRSSTGAPQRSHSFDPASRSDGGVNAAPRGATTPRAASSLAVLSGNQQPRATTPRPGAGAATLGSLGQKSSPMPRTTTGGGNDAKGGARPAGLPLATANKNTPPASKRYSRSVLQLMYLNSQFQEGAGSGSSTTKGSGNNNKVPLPMQHAVGKTILGFLRQPTHWFDRNSVQTHRMSLMEDPAVDWTKVVLKRRVLSGLASSSSSGAAGGSASSSSSATAAVVSAANKERASCLFLSAPSLPSTRSTTVRLVLRGAGANIESILTTMQTIQVGIVHESSVSARARPPAGGGNIANSAVEALTSARVPAIGVALDGHSFNGSRVEEAEFFKLSEASIKAASSIVVSIAFDQGSASVAFSLAMTSKAGGLTNASIAMAPSSPTLPAGAAAGGNNGSSNNNNATASAGHVLPVLAAFPCALPSGVAGKWFAAVSIDTTAMDTASNVIAEWL